jgi:hypothetical protein
VLLNRPPDELRRKIRMRERLRAVSESRVGSGNRNPVRLPARIRSGTRFSQEENEISSRIENLASNEKSVASREHQSSPLKTSHKPRTKTRSSITTKAKRTAQVKCENKIFPLKSNTIHITTKVTVLPPSFNWKLEFVHGTLLP